MDFSPRGEGTRHPTLRGVAAPEWSWLEKGIIYSSFHGEIMGNSLGIHGGFMGIYIILPDLWVAQLMASLVVIDSTMITPNHPRQ